MAAAGAHYQVPNFGHVERCDSQQKHPPSVCSHAGWPFLGLAGCGQPQPARGPGPARRCGWRGGWPALRADRTWCGFGCWRLRWPSRATPRPQVRGLQAARAPSGTAQARAPGARGASAHCLSCMHARSSAFALSDSAQITASPQVPPAPARPKRPADLVSLYTADTEFVPQLASLLRCAPGEAPPPEDIQARGPERGGGTDKHHISCFAAEWWRFTAGVQAAAARQGICHHPVHCCGWQRTAAPLSVSDPLTSTTAVTTHALTRPPKPACTHFLPPRRRRRSRCARWLSSFWTAPATPLWWPL